MTVPRHTVSALHLVMPLDFLLITILSYSAVRFLIIGLPDLFPDFSS